jgi:DNA helicase-2/ATP-dependent DNA helicase PcrA
MFAISSTAWGVIDEIPMPDLNRGCEMATDAFGDVKYHVRVSVHSITTDKDTTKQPGVKRQSYPTNLTAIYRIDLTKVEDPTLNTCTLVHSKNCSDLINESGNAQQKLFCANLPAMLSNIADKLEHFGCIVRRNTLADYLRMLSLYDLVCERSKVWQETLDEEIMPLFESLSNIQTNDPILHQEAEALVTTIMRLESYNVPLDVYGRIYANLQKTFTPAVVNDLCKHNLNIMLSDLMNQLKNDRSKLNRVPRKPGVTAGPKYNSEQRAAVETEEPLAIIQACAGSGKTTTIMGRIQYMIDTGIDPKDICVISFTNAAADHVKELNKDVKSMTIDSMIVNIYQHNFPNQEISTSQTFANGLDVYFDKDPVAEKLRSIILAVDNNVEGSFTRLNRYVERNIQHIVQMCHVIGHVTLSLAIVICYQLIDHMTEPDTVQASHMIMDEVQDTSIFQFIYALKHVHKYRQSLFLVGDSSQTLYEFRFANPRALNVMESSGVFHPYKLQTNYRSRPEILEMANGTLENIEANQIAQLRLESNQLRTPTKDSFENAVHIAYCRVQSKRDFIDNAKGIIGTEAKDYIDDCLAKHQSITILAHSHNEINAVAEALKEIYPSETIVSLAPAKSGEITILSRFVKFFWNDVRFMPTDQIITSIRRMAHAKIDEIDPRLRRQNMQWLRQKSSQHIDEWATSDATKAAYLAAKAQLDAGQIRASKFFDEIKKTIFAYESRINIEQQMNTSRHNNKLREEAAKSDAAFKTSTIHSAKGLEWDNVLIVYRDSDNMDEPMKRMYYVALTRAMDSEFILAYGTRPSDNSIIMHQYQATSSRLDTQTAAVASDADEED